MVGAFTVAGLAAAAGGAAYYAVAAPSSQVFGPAVSRGAPGRGRIALTFDDGPSESTPAVLDALARHDALATFFMCGANVVRLPDLAHRALAEGHELGNHTYTHPRLYTCDAARIREEIVCTQEAVEREAGQWPALFRPPFGIRWFGLYPAVRKYDLRVVMWSACVYDWRRPAVRIADGLLEKAEDGAIVLLHDGDRTAPGDRRFATAQALDRVLPVLADRGLRCVTVSELLA